MNAPDLDWSLPDWLIEEPRLLEVFERHGLDYSCGGKSLEFACRERGLDPLSVLEELRAILHEPSKAHPDDSATTSGGAEGNSHSPTKNSTNLSDS